MADCWCPLTLDEPSEQDGCDNSTGAAGPAPWSPRWHELRGQLFFISMFLTPHSDKRLEETSRLSRGHYSQLAYLASRPPGHTEFNFVAPSDPPAPWPVSG